MVAKPLLKICLTNEYDVGMRI